MLPRPRKRFGQNFLNNQAIINSIIQAIHPKPKDTMIEIGPGQGALTEPLLDCLDALTAIEIDKDLHNYLQQLPQATEKLQLIRADALTVDFQQFGHNLRIVGNLPYNISTPLLLHLMQYTSHIKDMHFMLQKEVAERLAAQPGTKTYGRLSIAAQYECEVTNLFSVPPTAFYPQPKVESTIIRLVPHQPPRYQSVDKQALEKLVAHAFSMRRKTLANNLKPLLQANDLIALGIDPTLRPEQISIADYIQIVNFFTK